MSQEDNFEARWAEIMARAEQRRQDAVTQLKACAAPLAALGVRRVIWSYDGYGDSGQIENCEVQPTSETGPTNIEQLQEILKTVDAETQKQLSVEALENLVYEILPDGFEINDGSHGEVTLDTDTAGIHIGHNERYTDSRYSEQNL